MTEYGDIYLMRSKGDNIPYVGITKDFKRRKKEHEAMINKNSHYNSAINNYVRKNKKNSSDFVFSIIEKSVVYKNIFIREIYWINYYNSYFNGFNCTIGGENPPRKIGSENPFSKVSEEQIICALELYSSGKYKSVLELSNEIGISAGIIRGAMYTTWKHVITNELLEKCKEVAKNNHPDNYKSEKAIKARFQTKGVIYWNGVRYNSIQECAKKLGVSWTTVDQRIKKGYSGDNDIKGKKFDAIPIVWNGIEYPSKRQLEISKNWSRGKASYVTKMGYKCDDDLRKHT